MNQPKVRTQFRNIVDIATEVRMSYGNDLRDSIVKNIFMQAEDIANRVVSRQSQRKENWDKRLDDILTSPLTGFASMGVLLGLVFWITVTGANVPSAVLADFLFWGQDRLTDLFMWMNAPNWLHGALVLGMYRGLAWVVSVMLPPMAIFFPLFTLLEDFGYLPRVAFNMDKLFKKACAHGKQALTMSMGFGCNAAGVIACRIIDSPRERLIATLTNNFVPCNGRFPTLIALASIFMGGLIASGYSSIIASVTVVGLVLIGIAVTLFVSWGLSKTILKGVPSSFTLELPPYRRPQVGRIIVRSIFDRTIFVLGRAVVVAAPAGLITWILANTYIGDLSIIAHAAGFLDPLARVIGLDGFILVAFILGLPANEIVLPILIMSYMSGGMMVELDSLEELKQLFVSHGWTWVTALNVMLFSLLHYPCATTLWTIRKETRSVKWAILAAAIPTGIAIVACFVVYQSARLFGVV